MVVTLGAGDREAGQRSRHDAERIGDALVLGQGDVGDRISGTVGSQAQVGRRREGIDLRRVEDGRGDVGGRDRVQLIAGELFLDEAIPGLVGVEGADDIIAVAPGVRADRIRVGVAVGVGVAGDVEPMAGPAFAVCRRGEQAFDEFGVGVGRGVGDEGGGFGRRRRESREVERRATDERRTVGLGGEVELLGLKLRADERVDGAKLGLIGEAGQGRLRHRLERPEAAVTFGNVDARGQGAGGFGFGDLRAGFDPGREEGELVLGHLLALLGHLAVADERPEGALLRIAGREHGRTIFGLPVHEPTQAEVDATLGLFLFAVAVRAVLLEDGADLRLVVRALDRAQSRRADEEHGQQQGAAGEKGGHGSEGSDDGFQTSHRLLGYSNKTAIICLLA